MARSAAAYVVLDVLEYNPVTETGVQRKHRSLVLHVRNKLAVF
jgi:hypothetical protein